MSDTQRPDRPDADALVRSIADQAWAELLRTDRSASLGIDSPLEQMQITLAAEPIPEITLEAARERSAFAASIVTQLQAVPLELLGEDALITRGVLSNRYGYLAEEARYYWVDFEVVPYKSSRPISLMTGTLRSNELRTDAQHECYINLLRRLARYFDQQRLKLEGQAERGIRLPKAAVDGTRSMYAGMESTLEADLLINDERRDTSGSSAAFTAEVASLVHGEVTRSLAQLVAALGESYRALAPDAVGIGQYPDGPGQYRRLIQAYTTLQLEPEALHQLGIERVATITAEILEKGKAIGLEGSLQKVFDALRGDPRFKASSAEQIAALYTADIADIAPKLADYFSLVPKAPYDAQRLAPAAEKVLTYGGYFPPTPTEPRGLYFFNASGLEDRTMLTHRALIYHELVPGHHFQLALQLEDRALHPMRRRYAPAGFIEGWAEYAASLCYEMDLYTDPYDDLGRKVMELFLAMRLVVDTGLAEFGWSLEKARSYMRDHIFQSDAEIVSESLRYAVGPAQALCYSVGYSTIWELRRRAERALGGRFDLRRFHECVIGAGSVPLDILKVRVEHYIGQAAGGEVFSARH
jgi:uncharacterized protein (DUF885 family)